MRPVRPKSVVLEPRQRSIRRDRRCCCPSYFPPKRGQLFQLQPNFEQHVAVLLFGTHRGGTQAFRPDSTRFSRAKSSGTAAPLVTAFATRLLILTRRFLSVFHIFQDSRRAPQYDPKVVRHSPPILDPSVAKRPSPVPIFLPTPVMRLANPSKEHLPTEMKHCTERKESTPANGSPPSCRSDVAKSAPCSLYLLTYTERIRIDACIQHDTHFGVWKE